MEMPTASKFIDTLPSSNESFENTSSLIKDKGNNRIIFPFFNYLSTLSYYEELISYLSNLVPNALPEIVNQTSSATQILRTKASISRSCTNCGYLCCVVNLIFFS